MKKPDLPEIQQYFVEIGLPETEARCFLDYYESCGWTVGRKPMVSWKHAANTWRRNYEKFNPKNLVCNQGLTPIDRRILYDEFTRIEKLLDHLRKQDVMSQSDLMKRKELRQRRAEIAGQLGIKF